MNRAKTPGGGSKPEPPKFPSSQLQPRHERIQVDHLGVALEVLGRGFSASAGGCLPGRQPSLRTLDETERTVQCRPPATRRRREWPEETLSQALMPRGAEAAPHSGVIPEVRTPADLRSFRSSPPVRSYRGTGKNEPKAGRSHLPDPRPCTYVCTRCAHALVCRRQHAPSAGCCFNAKMQPGQSSS